MLAPHVGVAHERERDEEVLAELLVCAPGLPLRVALERQRVDEDGAAIPELHVERARVPEDESVLKRALLHLRV